MSPFEFCAWNYMIHSQGSVGSEAVRTVGWLVVLAPAQTPHYARPRAAFPHEPTAPIVEGFKPRVVR
jgi:hypothetical protein